MVSLKASLAFPWLFPDDGLNPPPLIAHSLHLFIYGYLGSAGRPAPFMRRVLMLSARVNIVRGGGGVRTRGMVPLEILIIGLSKKQFPAFSGSELVNQEGTLRH